MSGLLQTSARNFVVSRDMHADAPTRFVEAEGTRFAYRRFGRQGGVPLVFFMHFTGTMDHWDPWVTDGLAEGREVILFNNAGISSTSGEVPGTITEMARHAAAFIGALDLAEVDVLGFSMGGTVVQELALGWPSLVRKIVLVGTGPRAGEGMASLTPEAQDIFGASYDNPDQLWLRVHFTPSERSQVSGRAFLARTHRRTEGRDPPVTDKVAPAQVAALALYGAPRPGARDYLKDIAQPALVVNGSNDVIIYTVNSFILQQNLPNATLVLYPDANHGSLFQYPETFVEHTRMFLDS